MDLRTGREIEKNMTLLNFLFVIPEHTKVSAWVCTEMTRIAQSGIKYMEVQ